MPRGAAVSAKYPGKTKREEKKRKVDEPSQGVLCVPSDYSTMEEKEKLKQEEQEIWTRELIVPYRQVLETVTTLEIFKTTSNYGMFSMTEEANKANRDFYNTILSIYLFARINGGARTIFLCSGLCRIVNLGTEHSSFKNIFATLGVNPILIEQTLVSSSILISWLASRGYNGLVFEVCKASNGYPMRSHYTVSLKDVPWKQTCMLVENEGHNLNSVMNSLIVKFASIIAPNHYLDYDFSECELDPDTFSFSGVLQCPMPIFNHPECKGIKVSVFHLGATKEFMSFTFSSERISHLQIGKAVNFVKSKNPSAFRQCSRFLLVPRCQALQEYVGNITVEFDIE